MRVWELVRLEGRSVTMRGPIPSSGDVLELDGLQYRVGEVRHVYRTADDGVPECVGVLCHVGYELARTVLPV